MTNRFISPPAEATRTPSYPEVKDILRDEDVEISDRILRDWSASDMVDFCEKNTVTRYLGDLAFGMFINTPKNFNGTVIVVPTGLGAKIAPGAVIQAHIIREIIDRNAALLVQAHASLGESVNNFSAEELWQVGRGDNSPLLDRLNVGLDSIEGASQVIYSGASLGASTTSAAFRKNSDMIVPAVAGTIIEPVHIKNWSYLDLGHSFSRSMGDFSAVLDLDAPEGMTGEELEEKYKVGGPRFRLKAGAEVLSLVGPLKHDRLQDDLGNTPDNIGIVHASSLYSPISPYVRNQAVADATKGNRRYEYRVFNDPNSSHGLTIAYPVHGALARHALQLAES